MNRAWIPAGALASVSVAGLIALGPLTDSLGTTVKFDPSVPVMTTNDRPGSGSVPVSVNVKIVGHTKTAALKPRGGAATSTPTNADMGFVADKRSSAPRVTPSNTPAVADVTPKAPVEPKKTPKRQQSIGTTGETNTDQGFAGGSDGSGSTGEQSLTPGSATP